MRNQPSEKELLSIAMKVLKERLLPELTGESRYNGLMVARSIEIVSRQFNSDLATDFSEVALLTELLEKNADTETLNSLLAKKIRENDFHKNLKLSHTVWQTLVKISKQKVSESNPKYLQSDKTLEY